MKRPTDRDNKKNQDPALAQKEMLPTIHQSTQVDDSYKYSAARVSS